MRGSCAIFAPPPTVHVPSHQAGGHHAASSQSRKELKRAYGHQVRKPTFRRTGTGQPCQLTLPRSGPSVKRADLPTPGRAATIQSWPVAGRQSSCRGLQGSASEERIATCCDLRENLRDSLSHSHRCGTGFLAAKFEDGGLSKFGDRLSVGVRLAAASTI